MAKNVPKSSKQTTVSSAKLERHHYALAAVIALVVMAIALCVAILVLVNQTNTTLDNAEQSNNVVPKITKPTQQ